MGIHTVSCDDEVWKKAMRKVGKGNLSAEIEAHLRKLAEMEDEQERKRLLEHSELTAKQQEVVRTLIREERTELTVQQFVQTVRAAGVYTRKDFIQTALERIKQDDFAPFDQDGSVIEIREVECYCGVQFSAVALAEDGCCIECGVELMRFDEDRGIKVV